MPTGWIKIHRKILDWGWYKDTNTTRLFLHLILTANSKDKEWSGITIKRGQVVTGLISLNKNTGISPQSIRTCLAKLKSTNEITIKSTNKFSIITIIKYEEYQLNDEQLTNKITNKLTNDQQTTNKQLTTTKEYKNNKNIDTNVSTEKKINRVYELIVYYFSLRGEQPAREQFPRWGARSKEILAMANGDLEVAKRRIREIATWLGEKGLTWTLDTVIKHWSTKINQSASAEKERDEEITKKFKEKYGTN